MKKPFEENQDQRSVPLDVIQYPQDQLKENRLDAEAVALYE